MRACSPAVSRAITWTESVGIPAVGIVCQGFSNTVRMVARAEGLSDTRLVQLPPPNIAVKSTEEVQAAGIDLLDGVINALTTHVAAGRSRTLAPSLRAATVVKSPRDIVFKGSLAQVNEHIIENVWCDGLPTRPSDVGSCR